MRHTLFLLLLSSFAFASGNGFISVDELKQNIDNKDYVILDVCDYDTYKAGHIKNAVMANVDDFRKKVDSHLEMKKPLDIQKLARSLGINDNSKVVLYGHAGKDLLKESYIATALIVNGHSDVSILNGGYLAWSFESNIHSSTSITSNKDGNFTSHYNPNILVDLNYVKSNIDKSLLIDARTPEIYYGTELSKGVARVGHIPHAVSSYWRDKFLKDDSLRNEDELKQILIHGLHVDVNDTVVSYCTGGMEASINWYLLYKYFGIKNTKLYDASMREWGNKTDTPMERFIWESFSK
jgi:thiosulfate/3-mercaptopyruvate sulfurtransferase